MFIVSYGTSPVILVQDNAVLPASRGRWMCPALT